MVKELKKWEKFGYLTALWERIRKWKNRYEKCRCICWIEKYVQYWHLKSWESCSCWCMKKELHKRDSTKEIINNNKYAIWYLKKKWRGIKKRCLDKNNKAYWGKGIQCEWETSDEFVKDMLTSFVEHVKEYGVKETTIDRINPNGNYCKENCRWTTWKNQARNTTKNVCVAYKWDSFPSITALCEHLWIDDRLVQCRMKRWWSIEDAVEKATKEWTKWFEIEYNWKKYKSHRELCRELWLHKDRVSYWLRHWYTLEQCLYKKNRNGLPVWQKSNNNQEN